MKTRKLMASTAAVLALSLGGLAVAATNPFSSAGAQATTTTTAPAHPSTAPVAASGAGRGQLLERALAPLVKDGTITQAQADAVTKTLVKDVAARGGLRGVLQRAGQRRKNVVEVAAKAIGITPAQLTAALKAKQSIAQVASAHHVATSTVTSALVTSATAAVQKAVAAGKLTAAQATKLEARLPKWADRVVQAHRK